MAISINNNASSLNASRQLNKSQSNLGKSFEKLSSGLRINRAADDAAGLKISERFNSQIKGLGQAIRNANDGISLVQTAEGALNETTSVLQRMRELAVQSANGTFSDSDRSSIQDETGQLIKEVDRIALETSFNGSKVLDGSANNIQFQVGENAGQNISISVRGATSKSFGQIAKNTGGAAVDANALGVGELEINGQLVRGSSNFAGSEAGQTADSAFAKAAAINASNTGVRAEAQATDVQIAASGVAVDADETLEINGVSVFDNNQGSSIGSAEELAEAINAVSSETGVVAEVDNVNDTFTLTAADGRNIDIATTGTTTTFTAGTTRGEVQLSSTDNIELGGDVASIGFTGVTGIAKDSDSIRDIDLSTQAGATEAIERIDAALSSVGDSRGELGALQNRFESTISNLSNVNENLNAAKSRLVDTDFAAESINLTRNQLLQQAGTSILAQSKASSQIALNLL
ncbi:flagellin [Candidatus Uabimicrobium amorphum]|uniref:Flagellin n=1 Tax=Uabimicrobium amorphum TaxID=2596890 RepID=A0A5S9INX3_UABAM|nr:flagellin [Candidatus Uabimicrobium amorphum]BBM85011.1 flagellin [Candidatus Uabimicrobium amorphum]